MLGASIADTKPTLAYKSDFCVIYEVFPYTERVCTTSFPMPSKKNTPAPAFTGSEHYVATDDLKLAVNAAITLDRKSTRLNSSHTDISRMPSSA